MHMMYVSVNSQISFRPSIDERQSSLLKAMEWRDGKNTVRRVSGVERVKQVAKREDCALAVRWRRR